MVTVGTGGTGTKIIRTDWPVTEGLEAGTTKLKENPNLVAEETVVLSSEHWGSI